MAFFNEHTEPAIPPQSAAMRPRLGVTSDVLKYAPRRLRPETGETAVAQAQDEARRWRERAFKAETRLRALETRVQNLAARAARS